jgi:hypothetical protein
MTDRRMEKLYDALTANERVALILECRKRGEPDDPVVRSTMPREQERDFQRLLKDVGIANIQIGMLILALYEAARAEEWRWRWFEALVARRNDLASLAEALARRDELPALHPPMDLSDPPDETMAGGARVVLKGLRDALVRIADQAYATEMILEKCSGELGVDALGPQARQYLNETIQRVTKLIGELEEWVGPIECGVHDEYLDELEGIVLAARRRP